MQNKDDASLWWESRHSQIQDFDIPEPEPDETPDFVTETMENDPDYVSDRDVKSELNMIRLNEPTAEIIVSMMDVILPLAFVLLIKGTEKEDARLEGGEREALVTAWAQYLKTTSFSMSPGGVLFTSILTIYGAKVTVALVGKKEKESENDLLRKQNEMLKQLIENEQSESGA
jgi:hypothetical protein